MKYKTPFSGWFLGKRRAAATTLPSGLALPENMLGGSSEGTTDYRLVDIMHCPKSGRKGIKKGDTVLVHELDRAPYQIDMSDRNIQVIPREKIMGVQDNTRTVHSTTPLENLEPVDNVIFAVILRDEERQGMIIIPDLAIQERLEYRVLVFACGPDVDEIKVGQTLLVKKDYGVTFRFGHGERCLAIREKGEFEDRAILGILENV